MADALREHFSANGPTPLYVVVGRGGPNLVRGMGALRDTCDALGLPKVGASTVPRSLITYTSLWP